MESNAAVAAPNPWSALAFDGAYEVEHYHDVGEAARAATTSVLGTVASVSLGHQIVESDGREEMRSQMLVVTVSVDKVLTGRQSEQDSYRRPPDTGRGIDR